MCKLKSERIVLINVKIFFDRMLIIVISKNTLQIEYFSKPFYGLLKYFVLKNAIKRIFTVCVITIKFRDDLTEKYVASYISMSKFLCIFQ